MPLSLFSVGHILLGTQPALRSSLFHSETFFKKTQFHLQVVINRRLLLGYGWGIHTVLLSALGHHLLQTAAGTMRATSVSVHSPADQSCWFRGPCFLGIPHPWWHTELWGEGFDRDIPLGLSFPVSSTPCILISYGSPYLLLLQEETSLMMSE